MTKLIILNGPPRCGKDTAANTIEEYFGEDVCKHIKISAPLKLIAASIIGKSKELLEETKDARIEGSASTYREAQIHTFEQLVPIYGEDWLSRWTINSLDNYEQDFFVLSDCGQSAEIVPFMQKYGPENLLVIQIMREGCAFLNDTRTYITAKGVRTRPMVNKDINTFKEEVIDFAGEFFGDE